MVLQQVATAGTVYGFAVSGFMLFNVISRGLGPEMFVPPFLVLGFALIGGFGSKLLDEQPGRAKRFMGGAAVGGLLAIGLAFAPAALAYLYVVAVAWRASK